MKIQIELKKQNVVNFIKSDWGTTYIERFYRTMAKPVAATYVAGAMSKDFIINLNDSFTDLCTTLREKLSQDRNTQ